MKRILEFVCWIRTGHEWVGEWSHMFCFWCGRKR